MFSLVNQSLKAAALLEDATQIEFFFSSSWHFLESYSHLSGQLVHHKLLWLIWFSVQVCKCTTSITDQNNYLLSCNLFFLPPLFWAQVHVQSEGQRGFVFGGLRSEQEGSPSAGCRGGSQRIDGWWETAAQQGNKCKTKYGRPVFV